jgi:hypothetical protein
MCECHEHGSSEETVVASYWLDHYVPMETQL